jgi:hypothetical protein
VLTPQALSTTKIDLEVNEDGLIYHG